MLGKRRLILFFVLAFVSGCSEVKLRPGYEIALAGEMVSIPGGTFEMGLNHHHAVELPVHTVTVQPFQLGKYEVTFAQWDACVADRRCHKPNDGGWGRHNRPVINVTWENILNYIDWLNDRTGGKYRLPTEAEWEYAARAGSATTYSWGNDIGSNRANCTKGQGIFSPFHEHVFDSDCGDSWQHTAPVGSFVPNAWGLHDMHGNVYEWVEDCWHADYQDAPHDGRAWIKEGDCNRRVIRGGSWRRGPERLSSACRHKAIISVGYRDVGFRLARDI